MKKSTVLLSVALTIFSSMIHAEDAAKLAQQKGCLACHQVDKKVVGPSFKDVAAKYSGKPDAVEKLSQAIQNGGVGSWGQIPMPKNNVTSAEAKALASWVLSLK